MIDELLSFIGWTIVIFIVIAAVSIEADDDAMEKWKREEAALFGPLTEAEAIDAEKLAKREGHDLKHAQVLTQLRRWKH